MITRIFPESLSVFKTFSLKKPYLDFIDVESKDGDLSLLERLPEDGFAVVGTRYPQLRSVRLLEQNIHELRHSSKIIISGLARGIDSKAHEFALENDLKTIAILGCGLDTDYPPENAHLRKKILQAGGLILSHFERAEPPLGRYFILRNRLIAGFAKAVWVVEAAAISGTLNTAKWAMDYHRDLYATPSFPGDHFFLGNEKLLSQKDTHRYPIAEPYFGTVSLEKTWNDLSSAQACFQFNPKTEIQKWILEIKSIRGECQIQILMNHASQKGLTLGKFYLDYEKELDAGWITQDEQGRVDLI